MATENTNITPAQQQKAERSLMLSVLVIIAAVAALAIVGFCFMNKPADLVEGQVEGTTVRISGKLPGRVVEFFAHELSRPKSFIYNPLIPYIALKY